MQANAKKVSRRLQNNPRHPAEIAADIVERVLATDGECYLETQEHNLKWWQLSMLDVQAFLLLAVLTALSALVGLLLLVVKLSRPVISYVWPRGSHRISSKQKLK